MKTLAICALAAISASALSQVTLIGAFAAPPPVQENFDSIAAGAYNSLSVFGVPATASRIGTTGSLVVRPWNPVNTLAQMLVGDGVDVRISTQIPMRRFGGYFYSGYAGVFSPFATFRFFDAANNPIGALSIPLTPTPTYWAFLTVPKWRRVEIYGQIPLFPGAVIMDTLTMRPN